MVMGIEEGATQVGAGGPMPNRLIDEKGKLKSEWLGIVKKFSDRITIGTDEFFFPIESKRPNQSFEKTWSVLDQFTPELAQKIGRDNAQRIYNLK